MELAPSKKKDEDEKSGMRGPTKKKKNKDKGMALNMNNKLPNKQVDYNKLFNYN
jgi:hypothetical protein